MRNVVIQYTFTQRLPIKKNRRNLVADYADRSPVYLSCEYTPSLLFIMNSDTVLFYWHSTDTCRSNFTPNALDVMGGSPGELSEELVT